MINVILATTSNEKIGDLSYSIKEFYGNEIKVIPISELRLQLGEASEDQDTVRGNAEQKLTHYLGIILNSPYKDDENAYLMTEDTGLFIDALGGDPGVRTARFSGSHDYKKTNDLILQKMKGQMVRTCNVRSCVSIVKVKDSMRMIKSFDEQRPAYVLEAESNIEGFAFDTIVRPFDSVFSYSELNKIGKLSRLIRLPRFRSLMMAGDYIIKESLNK